MSKQFMEKKSPFKKIFFRIITIVILLWAFLSALSDRYILPIMMYHNVNYTEKYQANTVSPEHFAYHMAFLKKYGFRVLSLEEFVGIIKSGQRLPRKSVVITFDDGYGDNYTYAFPILKNYGFPATIFIVSDKIDTEGYLTTEQIKEMLANGLSIESHTRIHLYLPNESYEIQKDQIFGSKRILEEKFSVPIKFFAYPTGGFSEQIKTLVKEAGYEAAFTTNRGFDRHEKDVYELNRIRFGSRDIHDYNLWMKLSGYYNFLRKTRNPY